LEAFEFTVNQQARGNHAADAAFASETLALQSYACQLLACAPNSVIFKTNAETYATSAHLFRKLNALEINVVFYGNSYKLFCKAQEKSAKLPL
jgi:hypothetical protein